MPIRRPSDPARPRARALPRPHGGDGSGTLAFLIGLALAYVLSAL